MAMHTRRRRPVGPVAVYTETHTELVDCMHTVHCTDIAVAVAAVDALRNMSLMAELHMLGNAIHLNPRNRLVVFLVRSDTIDRRKTGRHYIVTEQALVH